MSDYKAGYKSEVARWQIVPIERTEYEEYLKAFDLMALQGRIVRGEPNPIDPTYGGIGYTYYMPKTRDLGRVKVSLVERWNWKFEWEDVNIG